MCVCLLCAVLFAKDRFSTIYSEQYTHIRSTSYIYIYIYTRGSLNKFPDFFRMGTFIDSTHMKL